MIENDGLARARAILACAADATPSQQRLLVAAALRAVFATTPILVGGSAEAYWMSDEYRATDIDICPRPSADDEAALVALGLTRHGRHWLRPDLIYGVEFPGAGDDIHRTVEVEVGGAVAVVISLEDLYLDRVRQSTMTGNTSHPHFTDAVALLVAQWDALDRGYVKTRLRQVAAEEPMLGPAMAEMHRKATKRARRLVIDIEVAALGRPGGTSEPGDELDG